MWNQMSEREDKKNLSTYFDTHSTSKIVGQAPHLFTISVPTKRESESLYDGRHAWILAHNIHQQYYVLFIINYITTLKINVILKSN